MVLSQALKSALGSGLAVVGVSRAGSPVEAMSSHCEAEANVGNALIKDDPPTGPEPLSGLDRKLSIRGAEDLPVAFRSAEKIGFGTFKANPDRISVAAVDPFDRAIESHHTPRVCLGAPVRQFNGLRGESDGTAFVGQVEPGLLCGFLPWSSSSSPSADLS
jgi:hypothetical protein